jgi:hypothetical protein
MAPCDALQPSDDVLDRTVQATNLWLEDVMEATGRERHVAWHALGAELRA